MVSSGLSVLLRLIPTVSRNHCLLMLDLSFPFFFFFLLGFSWAVLLAPISCCLSGACSQFTIWLWIPLLQPGSSLLDMNMTNSVTNYRKKTNHVQYAMSCARWAHRKILGPVEGELCLVKLLFCSNQPFVNRTQKHHHFSCCIFHL